MDNYGELYTIESMFWSHLKHDKEKAVDNHFFT